MQKISTDKIDIKKKLFSIFTNFVSMVLKPKILRPVQFTRSVVSNSLRLQVLYIIRGILQARMGRLYLLQRIFPTQGLNPGLPHCGQILYQLSHKRSPKMLERAVYPFPSGTSQSRNRTRVFCIAGRFFTN